MTDADIDAIDGALADLRRSRLLLQQAGSNPFETRVGRQQAQAWADRCGQRLLAEIVRIAYFAPLHEVYDVDAFVEMAQLAAEAQDVPGRPVGVAGADIPAGSWFAMELHSGLAYPVAKAGATDPAVLPTT